MWCRVTIVDSPEVSSKITKTLPLVKVCCNRFQDFEDFGDRTHAAVAKGECVRGFPLLAEAFFYQFIIHLLNYGAHYGALSSWNCGLICNFI